MKDMEEVDREDLFECDFRDTKQKLKKSTYKDNTQYCSPNRNIDIWKNQDTNGCMR